MSTLTPTLAHTFCRALGKFKVSAAVPHHSSVPWLTGSNRKQRCPRCPITRVFVGSEDVTPYNWSLLKSSGVSNPRGQQGSGPSSGSRVVLLLASCKHRGGRVWPIQTKAWSPTGLDPTWQSLPAPPQQCKHIQPATTAALPRASAAARV